MQGTECGRKGSDAGQGEEALLRVEHVSKVFPVKKRRLTAVDDVNLILSRGEVLGIVGESGCGKSTLAKIIAGSLKATSGRVTLNGVEYPKLKGAAARNHRRNIQMVFQDPLSSFSPRMKIGTYLSEPRRNYDRLPRTEAWREAGALLEQVGLPASFLNRFPHELSGGQLQRVAIARAIAIDPPLLICDEATGALDVSIQDQVAALLVRLIKERNIGCIFIGHDPALVRSISDRVAVMYLGRVMELMPSRLLEQEHCHPYTKALLDSIFDVYCDQSAEIRLLEGEPPSPLRLQSGCAFAPRCQRCTERCRRTVPELKDIGGGHFVACVET
ncbi:MAG: ABC transporter ATP-binding protein [Oscillospiraceae bacterium]|nr:ABC transporter ATP-binding protein [Oscillospiraceae bacterium]